MKKNVGIIDRLIRILIAVIIGVLFFTNVITGVWGIVLLVLAAILTITATFSFCPLYFAIGLSSHGTRK